jgi:CubicO group peptidase (beta-lactamase class C family)
VRAPDPARFLAGLLLLAVGACRQPGPWDEGRIERMSLRAQVAQMVVPSIAPHPVEALARSAAPGVGGVVLGAGPPGAAATAVAALRDRADLPPLVFAELDRGVTGVDPSGTELPPAAVLGAGVPEDAVDLLAAEARAVGASAAFLAAPGGVPPDPGSAPLRPGAAGGFEEVVRGLSRRGLLVVVRLPAGPERFPGVAERARAAVESGAGALALAPGEGARRTAVVGALRRDLGFQGLVVAELGEGSPGGAGGEAGAAVLAAAAGADLLVGVRDPQAVIDSLVVAVVSGRVSLAAVRASVGRIFRAKAAAGLGSRSGAATGGGELPARGGERTALGAHRAALRLVGVPPATALRGCPAVWLASRPGAPVAPLRDALAGGIPGLRAVELDTLPLSGAPGNAGGAPALPAAACMIAVSGPGWRLPVRAGAAGDSAGAAGPRRLVWIELLPGDGAAPPHAAALVVAYGVSAAAQRAAAAAVLDSEGTIPVEAGAVWPPARTLRLLPPAAAGMRGDSLAAIDRRVRAALAEGLFEGAAVAVGRRGVLVKLTGYGTLGSAALDPREAVFDIASLTKVVGTTTAAMLAVEADRIELDAPLRRSLEGWAGRDRSAVTLRQLLTHTSGLPAGAWLFGLRGPDAALDRVKRAALVREPGSAVLYSDFGMILAAAAVEQAMGERLDVLLRDGVFGPLGMHSTGYAPDPRESAGYVPTLGPAERPYPLRGVVHDGNAFRLGGVAGHAGLFSTAWDLSVFAQTLLNGGAYGSVRVLRPGTVAAFTRRQAGAGTRALGWDTPAPVTSAGSYLSPRSFGHTGYTGTSMWIDPEHDLFVILLTNRTLTRGSRAELLNLRARVADLAALSIADERVVPRPGSVVARREAARRAPPRRRR